MPNQKSILLQEMETKTDMDKKTMYREALEHSLNAMCSSAFSFSTQKIMWKGRQKDCKSQME